MTRRRRGDLAKELYRGFLIRDRGLLAMPGGAAHRLAIKLDAIALAAMYEDERRRRARRAQLSGGPIHPEALMQDVADRCARYRVRAGAEEVAQAVRRNAAKARPLPGPDKLPPPSRRRKALRWVGALGRTEEEAAARCAERQEKLMGHGRGRPVMAQRADYLLDVLPHHEGIDLGRRSPLVLDCAAAWGVEPEHARNVIRRMIPLLRDKGLL